MFLRQPTTAVVKGGVVERAEESAIVQDESKDAAEAELRDEVCVGPALVLDGGGDVARLVRHQQHRHEHEEAVVVHQTVLSCVRRRG